MDNIVKWRIDNHFVPKLIKWLDGNYEYEPYAYPERLGGYLGYYNDKDGKCIAFLDTDLQITMMADLEA